MGLGQQRLNQLVDIVRWLLVRILVDPVEDYITRSLMTQLQHYLVRIRLLRTPQEQERLVALANKAVALASDGRGRIRVSVLLNFYKDVKNEMRHFRVLMSKLTALELLVQHDIGHVLNVIEALGLEVVQDVGNELLLSPDEEHTFLHDIGWDDQLLERLDSQKILALT